MARTKEGLGSEATIAPTCTSDLTAAAPGLCGYKGWITREAVWITREAVWITREAVQITRDGLQGWDYVSVAASVIVAFARWPMMATE